MTSAGALAGKAALITGASGIAAATARLFHAQGATVTVVDRDPERLAALAEELPALYTLEADLTTAHQCREVVARSQQQMGQLDILVNVAGLSGRRYGDGPVHEATDEGWDTVMNNNAKSTFTMCREALAPMLARRAGVILNTTSVLAYAPAATHFATHAYAASKGAVLSLSKAMAASYAPHGIRVNAVAPGLIDTPMSQRAQHDPAVQDYIRARQPLTGQPGSPDDVAAALCYLASDGARFVTGVVLEVAGGWSVAG